MIERDEENRPREKCSGNMMDTLVDVTVAIKIPEVESRQGGG